MRNQMAYVVNGGKSVILNLFFWQVENTKKTVKKRHKHVP